MRESTASDRLNSYLANNQDPVLDDAVILDLLVKWREQDQHGRRPDPVHNWLPNTAYAVGDIVCSTKRGTPVMQSQIYGRYYGYICTTAGTSGATEPEWPMITDAFNPTPVEAGTPPPAGTGGEPTFGQVLFVLYWRGRWNLHAAASEGWLMKAAQIAQNYGLTVSGIQLQRDQAYKHATEMAEYHQKRSGVRSIRIGAQPDRTFRGPDIPAWEGYFTDDAPQLLPYYADDAKATWDGDGSGY